MAQLPLHVSGTKKHTGLVLGSMATTPDREIDEGGEARRKTGNFHEEWPGATIVNRRLLDSLILQVVFMHAHVSAISPLIEFDVRSFRPKHCHTWL